MERELWILRGELGGCGSFFGLLGCWVGWGWCWRWRVGVEELGMRGVWGRGRMVGMVGGTFLWLKGRRRMGLLG